jgi:hypothetical protein
MFGPIYVQEKLQEFRHEDLQRLAARRAELHALESEEDAVRTSPWPRRLLQKLRSRTAGKAIDGWLEPLLREKSGGRTTRSIEGLAAPGGDD